MKIYRLSWTKDLGHLNGTRIEVQGHYMSHKGTMERVKSLKKKKNFISYKIDPIHVHED